MADYLAAPGVSRSTLKRVADRPSHRDAAFESTAAQQWGTLLNDLVVFGTREFYVRPDTYEATDKGVTTIKPWNSNSAACKEWLAEHSDKPVIRATGEHSAAWLERAMAKIEADPRCQALLAACPQREVSIFARHPEYHGLLMKGCLDMLGIDGTRAIFGDIKTTTDASTRGFSREILRFGYHMQFGHYRHLLALHGYSPAEGYLLIVEKGDDPRVQVRRMSERAMDKGDFDLDDELQIYARCKLLNHWPDFPDEPDPHVTGAIDLPEHCYGDVEELQGMTLAEENA